MKKLIRLAVLLVPSTPALAGASNFQLVNGTGGAIAELSIRRAGSPEWKPLGSAPGTGASSTMSFSDPDCAFDIRAKADGGPITWAGVNLCGAKSVILRTDPAAGAWVDYDQ